MKNLSQISDNKDIITKEYLVAGYEPLLPATPLEPGTKYLNGLRQWSTIAIGSGGYAANVYLTNNNSTLNPAYKALSYINDTTETESTITRSSIGETQGVTFLFDSPIGVTTVDAGTWKFAWTGKVNTTAGGTRLRIEVFKRTSGGVETVLFSVTSDVLSDTVYTYRTIETNQPIFTVNTTDTLGIKTYMNTTIAATVTGYILIGGTRSAFINSPLALRHNQLRGLNDDTNNVHVLSTERTNLTAITALSTNGFIKRTGSGTYSIDTSTYSLSTHNHNGTYQAADADLTSIAELTGTTGLLRKTAANTWTLDITPLGDMTIAVYGGSATGIVAKADTLKETRAGATQKTWVGTKAQYAAIVTKDIETCYITTDEPVLSFVTVDESGILLYSYMPTQVSSHISSQINPHNVTKQQIGLNNVDNTSDINKPISTLTQAALDNKSNLDHVHEIYSLITHTHTAYSLIDHTHSQYATINSPTFTGTVSGITASMIGLGNVNNTSDINKPISTLTQNALNAKAPINSPTFTGTVSGITKTMVGLGNVDNTSDASKPISTSTQSALDNKAPINNPTFTGTVLGISSAMVGLGNVTNESKATMFTSPTFTGTVTGITATMVGLGNVTNESKSTMFTSPTFTGTVSGVTASMVGLGNVTNESKVTMFTSPTFTGTVSGITATMVGLGNVTNESKSTMFTSPTFTGTVSGISATMVGLGNVTNESKTTMLNDMLITGTTKIEEIIEQANLVVTAYAAGANIDLKTGAVFYNTANATANPTFNFRGDGSNTLSSLLEVGKSITFTILITNSTSAYYPTAYTIDGTSITPKWSGSAPTSGSASAIDIYTYTIIKTAATPTYTVLASRTKFA